MENTEETSTALLSQKEFETMMILAYVYLQHNKFDKALTIYRALESISAEDYKIYLGIAFCEMGLNHYKEALEAAEKSFSPVMQRQERAISNLIKGQALWNLDRKREASLAIQQFIQIA